MVDYRVAVLLSAYNGEKYIKAQIESILGQDDIEYLTLIVRNDGSTDSTLQILQDIREANSNVEVIDGPNIGLVASFFELLEYAAKRALQLSGKFIPWRVVTISTDGKILD